MFISQVHRREEAQEFIIRRLKENGVDYKPITQPPQKATPYENKIFGLHLRHLQMYVIKLSNGLPVVVPKIICDMIHFIVTTDPEKEGLFQLSGPENHMKKLKNDINKGGPIPTNENVIHVASLLKTLFMELPEALIPISYHELLLKCMNTQEKLDSVLLACLLLPPDHVNTLACFMGFLRNLTNYSKLNKLTSNNLATYLTPTITRIEDKVMIDLVEEALKAFKQAKPYFLCKLLIKLPQCTIIPTPLRPSYITSFCHSTMTTKSPKLKNKDAEKNDPCLTERELTYKCFNDNDFNKQACVLQIENYKTCRGFWHSVQAQRRRDGVRPYLPPVEEREKIKNDYLRANKR